MTYRIKLGAYERYYIEKKYFGFLWLNISWVNNDHPEHFYDLDEAEVYIEVLCRRAKNRKVKPKVIKEIVCT